MYQQCQSDQNLLKEHVVQTVAVRLEHLRLGVDVKLTVCEVTLPNIGVPLRIGVPLHLGVDV